MGRNSSYICKIGNCIHNIADIQKQQPRKSIDFPGCCFFPEKLSWSVGLMNPRC